MEAFIAAGKVTKCPGMFSPELAELNRQRDETWRNMTPEERYRASMQAHRPRRGGNKKPLTEEQKKEKKRQYYREYYAKKRAQQN